MRELAAPSPDLLSVALMHHPVQGCCALLHCGGSSPAPPANFNDFSMWSTQGGWSEGLVLEGGGEGWALPKSFLVSDTGCRTGLGKCILSLLLSRPHDNQYTLCTVKRAEVPWPCFPCPSVSLGPRGWAAC